MMRNQASPKWKNEKYCGGTLGRSTSREAGPDVPEQRILQLLGTDASAIAMNHLRYNEQRPGNTLQRRRRVPVSIRLF
jgi:hypothetical protein